MVMDLPPIVAEAVAGGLGRGFLGAVCASRGMAAMRAAAIRILLFMVMFSLG
jgi:hypothetical protein